MPLAQLSIDLVAQTARFEADMRRAAGVVQQTAQRIDRSFAGIGLAAGVGAALGTAITQVVGRLPELASALVNNVAQFQDLEEKTGASAAALASFTTAGDVAGVSADQLAGFMVKLTGTLSKTREESQGAGPALKALGLNLEEFRNLAPEEQFQTLAERLNTFKDGAGKTAIAIALLGKSGADALPFFKELAESGLSQNRLTAEQIRLADALADRQARVRSELRQAAQIAAIQALPAFTALTEEFGKAARAALGLDKASGDLQRSTGVRDFAQGTAIALAVVGESIVGLIRLVRALGGSFESVAADIRFLGTAAASVQVLNRGGLFNEENRQALSQALEERNRIAAEANGRYVKLFTESGTKVSDALKFQFSEAGRVVAKIQSDPTELARRGRPSQVNADKQDLRFRLPDTSNAGKEAREAEQVRKALLDKALRDLQTANAAERDEVQFQQRFLEAQFQAGLVTLGDYYARRNEIEQRGFDSQQALFEQEAAALRTALTQTADPSERIKITERIQEAEAKAALSRQQFAQQGRLNALEEQQAYQQAADRVIEFRAQIAELQGDLIEASRLRADLAIAQAQRSSVASGISPDLQRQFEQATRAADAFAQAQREVNRITEQQSIAEQRIALEARVSGAGRADVEQRLFAVRQQALGQLAEELARVEAIASAAGPDSPAVQFAQQLRLEFERLQVTIDPAIERMRDFGDEVADAFGRAASEISINVRNSKDALKSLGDAILRLTTREFIEKPFADFARQAFRGISEGQGEFLRGIFGVSTQGSAPSGSVGGVSRQGAGLPAVLGGQTTLPGAPSLPTVLGGAGPALASLSQAAAAASQALGGGPVGGLGGLGDVFRVFDTSGAGTESTPSPERDILRRIEAGITEDVGTLGTAIDDVLPSFGELGQGLLVAADGLSALPQLIDGLFSGDFLGSIGSSIGGLFGFADGGQISGPGTGTSDSIPILASNGEFMTRAAVVSQPGALSFLEDFNRRGMQALKVSRFAEGGRIGGSRPSSPVRLGSTFNIRQTINSQGNRDRAAIEREAVINARAVRRELERHTA